MNLSKYDGLGSGGREADHDAISDRQAISVSDLVRQSIQTSAPANRHFYDASDHRLYRSLPDRAF